MGRLWLHNELVDRLAMLQQTETTHLGINQVAIEKDWWVTVTLKALFQTDCRDSLIFKGGTSLSKGFNIIERFSEDIDLSVDVRDAASRTQSDKWLEQATKKYSGLVRDKTAGRTNRSEIITVYDYEPVAIKSTIIIIIIIYRLFGQ